MLKVRCYSCDSGVNYFEPRLFEICLVVRADLWALAAFRYVPTSVLIARIGRQGDLMLCDACDLARFPPAFPTTSASTSDNCHDAADTNQVGNSVGDSSAGTPIDNSAVRVNYTSEVNELLCFLSNKLHNYPVSIVKKAALEFYLEGEIFTDYSCYCNLSRLRHYQSNSLLAIELVATKISPILTIL